VQDETMKNSLVPLILLFLAACTPAPETDTTANSGPNIRQVWIPMEDGVRLAADIYMPEDASDADSYPVLLEYLPYRKDESRPRNYSLYK
jgi:predicted acyl esterase